MQDQSHAWQNVGEPLNSPHADSQEAIRALNGRRRTVGRFEDTTLMWSYYIETLNRVEGRAERQAAEFAERAGQVAAEHTARIKALEGHIKTLKAREGPTERVESQAAELAALIRTLKDQLNIGEARAGGQAAESAGRAAQVAAEHATQIKTLEERIETLTAQLSAAETRLAERATEHHANIAAERVKTEAEQVKAARAIALHRALAAELEEERDRPWWKRIWRRSGRAEISESGSAGRAQWQLPSTTFDRAYRPGDKGAPGPLGRHP